MSIFLDLCNEGREEKPHPLHHQSLHHQSLPLYTPPYMYILSPSPLHLPLHPQTSPPPPPVTSSDLPPSTLCYILRPPPLHLPLHPQTFPPSTFRYILRPPPLHLPLHPQTFPPPSTSHYILSPPPPPPPPLIFPLHPYAPINGKCKPPPPPPKSGTYRRLVGDLTIVATSTRTGDLTLGGVNSKWHCELTSY